MAARRRELAALEAELADARERLLDDAWRPGRDAYWLTTIRMIEAQIERQRSGLAPALRPLPGPVGR
jgi:hypothetical protein